MSLWYDIKKKSYAYDAKESWLRSYVDKIVSALKTELLEKLGQHFAGKFGAHNAADINCSSGESVQTALDLEASERIAGDSLVRSLVTTEEEARIAGDNEVKDLVTTVEEAIITGDNGVKALVAQEENARIAGDDEVKALVTAEEEARIAGDNEVKDLIDAEKEERASALALKVDKVSGKALSTNDYSNADKLKLAGIESGAQVNSVTSVAGKTGAVTLGKSDVGLSNVDNTSDMNKPVSNATLAALENKAKKAANKESFEVRDFTTAQMLKSFTFWRAFLALVCLTAVGSAVISFARDLALSGGAEAALATTLVGVLAVCNGLGRIITGAVFDAIGRRKTMLCANVLTICAAAITLLAVSIGSLPLCIAGLCLTGISYGACPTITSAFTSSFFGMKYFSTNMAFMTFTVMIGSFIATASNKILEVTGGYTTTFMMLLLLTSVALILNIFIRKP